MKSTAKKLKAMESSGNSSEPPLHRMHEKSIAEKCRDSEKYRRLLFEKIDTLIDELRSDKVLYRKRKERGFRK